MQYYTMEDYMDLFLYVNKFVKNEMITLRLRNMPFKTKLTPNYKMDWGKQYPKATYPEREKRTVNLFDIRDYVKQRKKEKMNEMLGNMGGNNASTPMPSNPFGGMPSFNPFVPTSNLGGMPSSPTSLNVDDLVKKIDAKIAELEEEERKEKEEAAKKQQEALANNPVAPDKMYKNNTSDDAFFDDFFSDD